MNYYISEGAAVPLLEDADNYERRARILERERDMLNERIEANRLIAWLLRRGVVLYALRILEDDGCPHHQDNP